MDKLTGTIQNRIVLTGNLLGRPALRGEITIPTEMPVFPVYPGPYTATPRTDADVVLPTARHLMSQDVFVDQITYTATTNPAGGKTVYIE